MRLTEIQKNILQAILVCMALYGLIIFIIYTS